MLKTMFFRGLTLNILKATTGRADLRDQEIFDRRLRIFLIERDAP